MSFVFECGFHLKEESPFIPCSVVSCVIAQRLNRLQESMVLFGWHVPKKPRPLTNSPRNEKKERKMGFLVTWTLFTATFSLSPYNLLSWNNPMAKIQYLAALRTKILATMREADSIFVVKALWKFIPVDSPASIWTHSLNKGQNDICRERKAVAPACMPMVRSR